MIGLLLALLAALGVAAQPDPPAPASNSPGASGLGDAQLVGQRLVTGFEGERPPAALRRRIRAGRLAGVILFADNFDTRAEAERLARELQAIRRPAGLGQPLLVMVDQEGGQVKRLPGPPSLSAAAMGAAGRRSCRRQGAATARLLERSAINVDLAPVLDVARPGSAIESEQRSFGQSPQAVERCAGPFAAALERNGVVPVAKHFPGIGAARVNTDAAVQRLDLSRRRLRRFDEAPYREFVAGGARGRLVMLSSAVYSAFSERPAALTRSLATDELRGRLGFDGVSITDALETASTAAFGGPTRSARLAARAGTDLLLFTELDSAKRAAKALRRDLRDAAAAGRARFRASVGRVLELRRRLAGG